MKKVVFFTKKSLINQIAFILLPIILLLTIFLVKDYIISLSNYFPYCSFRKITGYYCPGCGNTRSVISFLKGNISWSLRYNLTPIFIFTLLLLVYIEQIMLILNKKISIIPRCTSFWVFIFTFFILYYIFRNFIPYLVPE